MEIAHQLDENPSGTTPAERLIEILKHQPKDESPLEGTTRYTTEPLGKCLRVAEFAGRD